MKVATMLMACVEGSTVHTHHQHRRSHSDIDEKDAKLSQSFASAFNMKPPKLMTSAGAADANGLTCPGTTLTFSGTGGAFLDGCYKNTTR